MTLMEQGRHYIVEGVPYSTGRQVWEAAKERGFTGSEQIVSRRLVEGKDTWAQLCAPVNERIRDARIATAAAKRAEMAAVIAAMDARRAAA